MSIAVKSWVNCFLTTAGFELRNRITQSHINSFTQSSGGVKGRGPVCLYDAAFVLSVWVHLLLWKKDDGSKRRMNTVSTEWLGYVYVCPYGLEAKEWESRRATDQFPFIVVEWRLEMHGLLWPRFISPFSFCSSSLAQWHNIRRRERQRGRD